MKSYEDLACFEMEFFLLEMPTSFSRLPMWLAKFDLRDAMKEVTQANRWPKGAGVISANPKACHLNLRLKNSCLR